jgi:hypothetical protein
LTSLVSFEGITLMFDIMSYILYLIDINWNKQEEKQIEEIASAPTSQEIESK